MKVSDVFTELVHGELSAHAVAMMGSISDTDTPRVISYINSGLLALYTRYPLLMKELRLRQYSNITSYKLRIEYARTNTASTAVKYIIDSTVAPFTGDVIRVEEVADEVGDVLEINSSDYDKVVLLPSMDTLEIPNPTDTNVLFVVYRAKHPQLSSKDDDIILPMHMLTALYAYVGSRVYAGGTAAEHVAKTAELTGKYEMLCQQLEMQGMVNSDIQKINMRPELGGWI